MFFCGHYSPIQPLSTCASRRSRSTVSRTAQVTGTVLHLSNGNVNRVDRCVGHCPSVEMWHENGMRGLNERINAIFASKCVSKDWLNAQTREIKSEANAKARKTSFVRFLPTLAIDPSAISFKHTSECPGLKRAPSRFSLRKKIALGKAMTAQSNATGVFQVKSDFDYLLSFARNPRK